MKVTEIQSTLQKFFDAADVAPSLRTQMQTIAALLLRPTVFPIGATVAHNETHYVVHEVVTRDSQVSAYVLKARYGQGPGTIVVGASVLTLVELPRAVGGPKLLHEPQPTSHFIGMLTKFVRVTANNGFMPTMCASTLRYCVDNMAGHEHELGDAYASIRGWAYFLEGESSRYTAAVTAVTSLANHLLKE